MSVRYAVALLPAAIMVLLFTGVARDFFHKDEAKQPASEKETSFEKLGIEKIAPDGLAPDFTLKDIRGKTVTLRALKGKVVFLNFWATWCGPCVLEMPTMEKLHQEYASKGLVILAINFRESREDVKAFLDKHMLTFTTLLSPDGKVFELYRAWGLPSSMIINKKGQAVGKATGYRDWYSAPAREFFQRLLEEG